MKECFDEGSLQAYFDGELSTELAESVSRHLTTCVVCAGTVHQAERENALMFSALEPEMSQDVPTEQLRARINAAIEAPPVLVVSQRPASFSLSKLRVLGGSGVNLLSQFLGNLSHLASQRAAAFASILALVALGSIFAVIELRNGGNLVVPPVEIAVGVNPPKVPTPDVLAPPPIETAKKPGRLPRPPAGNAPRRNQIAGVKLIPGEENYLKTIAALDIDLKERGPQSMIPAMRSEYERNLKLVDYAIAASRSTAKRNPNDPQATEFMFAAYQNKIDLMNNIAEQAQWARR